MSADADQIATAFLAGPWDPPAMAGRLQVDGGRRGRRAALRLAETVHHEHPTAPRDRPRELTAFVAACLRVLPRSHLLGADPGFVDLPTAMGPAPWPVEPIDTVGDLAGLVGMTPSMLRGYADPQGRERTEERERLRHYRYRWVAKRSGGARLIEAPKERLKHLQRVVLRECLGPVPAHPAAHGFRRGRSPLTHAAVHTGRATVITIDLEDFFPSIGAGRVYAVFRRCGYPEPVAHLLTALVTNTTPLAVRRPPEGLRASSQLAAALGRPHLAQGAPTSPALANLCAHRLDRRLAGLAAGRNLSYSRYADDVAISSGRPMTSGATGRLVQTVTDIAAGEGFRVNDAKTSVQRAGQRQVLTSLVVNERVNVRRADHDRLKAILTNVARHGPAAENRDGHPDLAAHLLGRVAWVAQANPARGARLRAIYDSIDWS